MPVTLGTGETAASGSIQSFGETNGNPIKEYYEEKLHELSAELFYSRLFRKVPLRW